MQRNSTSNIYERQFNVNIAMDEPQLETSTQYMIAGLGNPGRQYKANRHNIGFILLDRLAAQLETSFSRVEFKALTTKARLNSYSIHLAKPQTFMNLSGEAIAPLIRYYKIPVNHLLVVYDDVDLPFGALRLRPSGGSGGHKGMASIIEKVGTQDIPRLRLGIGRPPGRMEAAEYVLQDFSRAEMEQLPEIIERGIGAIMTFIRFGIDAAMNHYNAADAIGSG
jgi:PTH1 family peptidyl-tRNA hydrolase